MYNAVYIALRELGKIRLDDEQEGLRRRAIVLLSDGEDTSSLVTFDEVLDVALRSDSVIYTIGLGLDASAARRAADPSFVLTRLAQQTGGRAFFPGLAKDLTGVYADIRNELSSQYLLAYVSSNERTGRWRNVNVRVNRPGLSCAHEAGVLRWQLGDFPRSVWALAGLLSGACGASRVSSAPGMTLPSPDGCFVASVGAAIFRRTVRLR